MTPGARLTALQGAWRVSRVIRHGDGTVARFAGKAIWAHEAAGLRCIESGEMTQDGSRFSARRETIWRAQGAQIVVEFGDGRPFHRFASAPRAAAHHDCPPDIYRLTYDFTAAAFWTCRWHVRGPRKDYRAITRHSRH